MHFPKTAGIAVLFSISVNFIGCSDNSPSPTATSTATPNGYDELVANNDITTLENESTTIPNAESLTDLRDGQTYRIVTIGTQTWMAQNLNYETDNSYCYEDEASNCTKYGRLYTWAAAMEACPNDWHLPSKEEFEALLFTVSRKEPSQEQGFIAGLALKSTSGWQSGGGTDAFSFTALPAGFRSSNPKDYINGKWRDAYYNEGASTYFWGASRDSSVYISNDGFTHTSFDAPISLLLGYYYDDYAELVTSEINSGRSVRCIKNAY